MQSGIRGFLLGALMAAVATGGVMTACITRQGSGSVDGMPRTSAGKPNLSGYWQTNNGANWDLQAHDARPGAVTQQGVYSFVQVPAAPSLAFGAAGGVPGSLGVVDGDGQIPYTPEAAAKKMSNGEHWLDRDPEVKCFLPGVPRATYQPYPFQIVQGTNKMQVAYEFSNATRTIHMDEVEAPPDETWMGHSVGRWDGDSLVVDVSHFNDKTWFDRAGNFHSEALHVVERFVPMTSDIIRYEVTIEDPKVFTRPWKISMPLYRRVEPNMRLMEYRCVEFVEELLFGNLRKNQLVKRWEGETLNIDITRKVAPGERLYDRWNR